MKELVEVIAKALVDNPDEVVVTETEKESGTFIELKVAPSDMGTDKALCLLTPLALFQGCRTSLLTLFAPLWRKQHTQT